MDTIVRGLDRPDERPELQKGRAELVHLDYRRRESGRKRTKYIGKTLLAPDVQDIGKCDRPPPRQVSRTRLIRLCIVGLSSDRFGRYAADSRALATSLTVSHRRPT